jgi:hypothetical protein
MELRPEDVDALSLEDASDWLDKRGISFELLETHGEVLDLIKATLAYADSNTREKHINVSLVYSNFTSHTSFEMYRKTSVKGRCLRSKVRKQK